METWKDIYGYTGYYQVSNKGRIRSLNRKIIKSNGVVQRRCGYVMKGTVSNRGYHMIRLSRDGVARTVSIHRLVARAFLGKPENKLYNQVDHINGIKTDNRIENLRWCDNSINQKNAYRLGKQCNNGENHPSNKIDENQAIEIKTLIKDGYRQCEISKITGVSKWIVQDISRNKTWRHI